jgi:single stranded DNA-binding protein
MNRQWTDSDQQVNEETDWIPIVVWNKEKLADYLTRGSRVYVEGRIQTRSYEDDAGVKRYVTEVIAQNIILLGSNGGSNGTRLADNDKADTRAKSGKNGKGRQARSSVPENEELDPDEV